MAVMGVRVNQGGGGLDTGVAAELVKALFGDPEREMKLAMARREYETEALRQQYLQAQTGKLTADEAAIEGAVQPYRKVLRDNLARSGAYDTPEQEAAPEPVPVDLSIAPPPAVPLAPVEVAPLGADAMPKRALPQPPLAEQAATVRSRVPLETTLPDLGDRAPVPVDLAHLDVNAMPEKLLPQPRPADAIRRPEEITHTPEDRQAADQAAAELGIEPPTDEQLDAMVRAQLREGGDFGQTMGSNAGLLGTIYGNPESQGRNTLLYTKKEPANAGTADLELVQKLRKEFQGTPEFQKWSVSQGGYKNMLDAMKTLANVTDEKDPRRGPADMRLLYNYLKLLDPNTGVKEGEYSSAREAGGPWAQLWNMYDGVVSGAVLDNPTRGAFMKEATGIYNTATEALQPRIKQMTHEADLYKIDPSRIVDTPASAADYQSPIPEGTGISEQMIQAQIEAALPRRISRDQALMLLIAEQKKAAAAAGGQ